MTTVADLLPTRTRDQITGDIFAVLSAGPTPFPVTAWQVGAVPRTVVKASATVLSGLYGLVGDVGAAAFLSCGGKWLTLHAKSRFDVDRALATFAQHTITLHDTSGIPRTITPGQLLVTTPGGTRFRSMNTANVVVPAGGASDPLIVRCETVGSTGNTAPTIITSPAFAGLSFTYGSLSLSGSNEESDPSLRARCLAKWSTLGRGANLAAIQYIATSCPSAPTVTRARVVPGGGDGTLTVYVAQSASVAEPGQVSAITAWLSTRKPVTDTPSVIAATANVVPVTGTIAFESASFNTSAAQGAIADALTAYIVARGLLDGLNVIDLGGLYAAIYNAAPGITDVDLSAPSGDVVLSTSQIGAAGTFTLTFTP